MYRPQLKAISTPLSASSGAARGRDRVSRNQPRPYFQVSQPQTSSALHTTRWAMICIAGTSFSCCQYSGISPHAT